MKTVDVILPPPPIHWVGDGFRVHNFFPSHPHIGMTKMSPFFLMDYNSLVEFTPRNNPRGVGPHPHRGFETVTIAYKGRVAHHDSRGNAGVIGEGDVQWMTAGSGLLHKEYHEETFSQEGGPFQMVQLWVNLPAKDKMTDPKYQALTRDMMGKVFLPENKARLEIVAGSFQGIQGPAFTFTPIFMASAFLEAGGSLPLNFPADWNTGLLVIEGEVKTGDGQLIPHNHFARMANEGTDFTISSDSGATVLILSGEPIQEPIASYGPFVMNTRQELEQAYMDFNSGKFGYLE